MVRDRSPISSVAGEGVIVPVMRPCESIALSACRRHDLQMVVLDGRPRVALPEWDEVFRSRGVASTAMKLDGRDRIVDAKMLRAAMQFGMREPGAELCH